MVLNVLRGVVDGMPENLGVQVTDEHIEKYKKCKPIPAILEFIWNALDADANNIIITFNKNELEAFDSITISDDGHGINKSEINDTFGKFGSTYKLSRIKSPKGRIYHGKQGLGRYRGFALGNNLMWETTFCDNVNNKLSHYSIEGRQENPKLYIISDLNYLNSGHTGTRVIINNLSDTAAKMMLDELVSELENILAPYLLAYPGINIYINDKLVDPKNSIEHISDFDILIPENEKEPAIIADLKIIEWKRGKSRNQYLCTSNGIALAKESSGLKTANFPHAVYILSNYFEELQKNGELELRDYYNNYKKLIDKVEECLNNFFRERLSTHAQDTIKALKAEGVYPYPDNITDSIGIAEREVFDICASNVTLHLPGFTSTSKKSKKFTLNLLKEAIQRNPSSMKKILGEVLELPKDQINSLAKILEKTTLSSIIATTKMITDRLNFINGFEQIVISDDKNKYLKERSQLQKILINELWIFGDQYEYGCDDISLKNALIEHLKTLGRDQLIKQINYDKIKGKDDIPDICLYKQFIRGTNDQYENLVIELKRPTKVLNTEELAQIERYAVEVSECEYFDKQKTAWTFILIGNHLGDYAKMRCNQPDRRHGLITTGKNFNVWVKEWSEVIQEAKGRHEFLKEKLKYSVDDNEVGMKYLKDKYDAYLPDEIK